MNRYRVAGRGSSSFCGEKNTIQSPGSIAPRTSGRQMPQATALVVAGCEEGRVVADIVRECLSRDGRVESPGGSGPRERVRLRVVVLHKETDLGYQFFHAAEGSAADGPLGNEVEPDFDMVWPGCIGGGVVDPGAGMSG